MSTSKRTICYLVLGKNKSGKTSLIEALNGMKYEKKDDPFIGTNVLSLEDKYSANPKIQMIDFSGNINWRQNTKSSCKEGDFVLICIDLSLTKLEAETQYQYFHDIIKESDNPQIPVIEMTPAV